MYGDPDAPQPIGILRVTPGGTETYE